MIQIAVPPSSRPQPFGVARVAYRGEPAARQQAAEVERRHLARELHDGAIQEVLAAGLAIDLCLADVPAGSLLRDRLEDARRLTASALRRLRSSLQSLREGANGPDEDLPDLLRRLRSKPSSSQLEVSVEVTGTVLPLGPSVCRPLYQMASEFVFNAAVHGGARRAVIRLSYARGGVTLCVADDGRGRLKTLRKIIRGEVPGTGGGYHTGLADIAARAEEMGWALRADRSDLGGIAVQVVLPAPVPGEMRGEAHG